MRHVIASVISVIVIVGLLATAFFAFSSPASASGDVKCTAEALGESMNVTVTCTDENGAILGPGEVDLSAVDLNVIVKAPTKTVRPAPVRVTKTKIVRPAPVRVTETVRPAPTIVVRTKTVRPAPVRVTVTPRPVIVTRTVEVAPRQDGPGSGMIDHKHGFFSPDIDFGDEELTVTEAGLGAISILTLALVGLLAVYGGYRMGISSKETDDTHFMRAMLERAKTHR